MPRRVRLLLIGGVVLFVMIAAFALRQTFPVAQAQGPVTEDFDSIIDKNAERIIGLGERIRRHPELGFKEFKTAALVARMFEQVRVPHRTGLAVTGVKAELKGARPGPTLALIGELDALVVSGHPLADPATGAAHACGHNAQVTAVVGATMALVETGVPPSGPIRSAVRTPSASTFSTACSSRVASSPRSKE